MIPFVCDECAEGVHENCEKSQLELGTETWCDCQHKPRKTN